MGVLKISCLLVFTCWVLSLRVEATCDCPGISLKLLQAPHAMSNRNSAAFAFESYFVTNGEPCTTCSFACKLDDGNFSECEDRKVTYGGLLDGKHSFKVCSNGSVGLACACHYWTIDTVPPTASLTSSTSFTNALNFTVNVSFSETCSGGGGFRCSSVEGCNLHVQGAGQVVPSSLRILQPNLTYSLLVSLESSSQYGRLMLVMDKDFCNDRAGNRFMQTTSSILTVHYDRRNVTGPPNPDRKPPSNNFPHVVSTAVTAAFLATSFAAGLLSISTASLQSLGALARPSSFLTSEPSRNLFRMACHVQVFALSRWLPVELPVEYYELARRIQWTIPYFSLPWEAGHIRSIMAGSNPPSGSKTFITSTVSSETYASIQPSQDILGRARGVNGPPNVNGWRDFGGNMFWLAVIGGGLMLLHAVLLLILKSKKKNNENQRDYGALSFPRFEIFMLIFVLPCICQASANVIRGRTPLGIVVGILLLGLVSFALLTLLTFLFSGVTRGKLLQYEEDHQVGRRYQWYQELVRVTLGPGKGGQWTWKNQPNSNHLIMFGPLFEDLRGPPQYMLSQISRSNPHKGDRIIAPEDESKDAEAPFIQKLFRNLRMYYPLLESIKRVSLGIIAGAYSGNRSSRTPTITLLCITGFQLFFLVLKKPFISKRVQLVQIISVCTEVGLFASCAVLPRRKSSAKKETPTGSSMVMLFLAGFVGQMVNEWCALYLQTKRLGPNDKSFFSGLKVASRGLVSIFLPFSMIQDTDNIYPTDQPAAREPTDTSFSADRNQSSITQSSYTDKPWQRQQKDLAKAGTFLPFSMIQETESMSPIDQPEAREPTGTGSSADNDRSSSSHNSSTYKAWLRPQKDLAKTSTFLPSSMIQEVESMYSTDQPEAIEPAYTSSSADRNRNSSSQSSGTDKPWLRHQKDLAKASTFLPSNMIQDTESMFPTDQPEARESTDTSLSANRNRSFSSQSFCTDKPWMRQQRDLAKASVLIPSSMIQDTQSMFRTDQLEAREPVDTSSLADRYKSSSNMIEDTESMFPIDQPDIRAPDDTSSSAGKNRSSSSQSSGIDKPWLRHQRDLAKASTYLPSSMIQDTESMFPTDQPEAREPIDTSSSADGNRRSSSQSLGTNKPWLRHQRDLAKASTFLPSSMIQDIESMFPTDQPEAREPTDTSLSADRNRSSSSQSSGTDKPWMRQQRDLAKASVLIPSSMIQDTQSMFRTDQLEAREPVDISSLADRYKSSSSMIEDTERMFPIDQPEIREPDDTSSSTGKNRSSSSQSSGTDRPWLRHQRDLAKVSTYLPSSMIQDIESMFPTDQPEAREPTNTSYSANGNRRSSSQSLGTDKPWLRHQRDLAKASTFLPSSMIQDTESVFLTDQPEARELTNTSFLADRNRSSSSRSSGTDKPWMRQQRDLAKAGILIPSSMIQDTKSMFPIDQLKAREPANTSSLADRNRSFSSMIQDRESIFPIDQPEIREPEDTSSSASRKRSSSSQILGTEKPWLRHQTDLAKASTFLPFGMIQDAESIFPTDQPAAREPTNTSFSANRNRSSSSRSPGTDKPWMRQQRDLAKASIFIPSSMIQDTEGMFPSNQPEAREDVDTSSSADKNGSSSSMIQDTESMLPTDQPETREPEDTSS